MTKIESKLSLWGLKESNPTNTESVKNDVPLTPKPSPNLAKEMGENEKTCHSWLGKVKTLLTVGNRTRYWREPVPQPTDATQTTKLNISRWIRLGGQRRIRTYRLTILPFTLAFPNESACSLTLTNLKVQIMNLKKSSRVVARSGIEPDIRNHSRLTSPRFSAKRSHHFTFWTMLYIIKIFRGSRGSRTPKRKKNIQKSIQEKTLGFRYPRLYSQFPPALLSEDGNITKDINCFKWYLVKEV